MNPVDQIFNTHSFGVDDIYGRHGSRFPTGELKELIFITSERFTHSAKVRNCRQPCCIYKQYYNNNLLCGTIFARQFLLHTLCNL